ncbi:hypothetical protein PAMA_016700 [Pampus argenteus]
MTLSQLAVEDLCLVPSFLMADPMGPLLDQDEEEALSPSSSLEGKAPASPPLSFSSSYASSLYQTMLSPSLSSTSPPPSPPPIHPSSLLGTKAGVETPSLPWLGAGNLLDSHVGAEDVIDDLAGMDWMSEKIDLGEFDNFLASLDSPMDPDLNSLATVTPVTPDSLELGLSGMSFPPLEFPLPGAAEAKTTEVDPSLEVVMKSEPTSPAPPQSPLCPPSTLELGSEMDVVDAEKTISLPATIIPDASGSSPIVLLFAPSGHLMVVPTNKEESSVSIPDLSVNASPSSSDCDSDSGIESFAGSPPRISSSPPTPSPTAGSSRTKPYSKSDPTSASSPSAKSSRVKSVSGAPKVVEKKLKKMEQNKTAANRYRQKKRVEQELLNDECDELEKRNSELAEKAESISREIQYLKDLMEEVRKHRRGKTSSVA